MARLIDAVELKQRILEERDKIPKTLPSAIYEFGIEKPNHHGNSMRGGIRKALRCMEQCKTVDAVEVVRCKDCKHKEIIYGAGGKMANICACGFGLKGLIGEGDFCSYGKRRTDG